MESMPLLPMPRDNSLDSTLALLSDGYAFISKSCQRYQSDIFETRLMLRKVSVRREQTQSGCSTMPIGLPAGGSARPASRFVINNVRHT
jgi:fatty-acid peroxygenase